MVSSYMKRYPNFYLPHPIWYFDPESFKKGKVSFSWVAVWLEDAKRKALIKKVSTEVRQYSTGKGENKLKSPLELYNVHQEFIDSHKDPRLNELFKKFSKDAILYGNLKRMQKI